jgi:hypothetical protein
MIPVPLDKQAHALSGLAIVFIFTAFAMNVTTDLIASGIGLLLAIVVGAIKEWWWDARHPATHTVDFWDFAATSLGGLAAFIVILIS